MNTPSPTMTATRAAVMAAIDNHQGPDGATRRELIDVTGFSEPTMFKVTRDLLNLGWVSRDLEGQYPGNATGHYKLTHKGNTVLAGYQAGK